MYTKGTVLSVCIQCVDTLVLASKHAEGMSLRCVAICALAYCGRHKSSHIIKAHTDSEIQQEDYLWKFVLICGFKAKLQIFTNYLWAKWPVSQ